MMKMTANITLRLAVLMGFIFSGVANALLPNPTAVVPSTSVYANTADAGTVVAGTPLAVLSVAPPPLLNESVTQIALPVQNGLSSAIYAYVVRNSGMDDEELIPIQQGVVVQKGDIIEYQGYFTNYSQERIRRASVTLGIPNGVELVGGIIPLGASASVDSERFSRTPLRGNIGGVVQDIPYRFYRALRWTVEDIGINGTAVVKYRAVLQ